MVVTVSAKYQVVIPKDVRRALAITSGMRLSVLVKGGTAYLVPMRSLAQARGLARHADRKTALRDKKDRAL